MCSGEVTQEVGDGGCCNLWGHPCETSMEGGKPVILRNYLIIVSPTVSDCFVY